MKFERLELVMGLLTVSMTVLGAYIGYSEGYKHSLTEGSGYDVICFADASPELLFTKTDLLFKERNRLRDIAIVDSWSEESTLECRNRISIFGTQMGVHKFRAVQIYYFPESKSGTHER